VSTVVHIRVEWNRGLQKSNKWFYTRIAGNSAKTVIECDIEDETLKTVQINWPKMRADYLWYHKDRWDAIGRWWDISFHFKPVHIKDNISSFVFNIALNISQGQSQGVGSIWSP